MRRRAVLVAAASVAAVVGAGAVWSATSEVPDGSSLLVGWYRPTDQIALTNLTVGDGTYRVEFAADVQFFSSSPGATLECGLVDASGRIGYLDGAVTAVAAGAGWTRIGASATYDVPEITLGIRCSPTATGSGGIGYRAVTLTAVPVG